MLPTLKIKNPITPRWHSTTLKMLGFVMVALGMMLCLPTASALILGEHTEYYAPLVPPLIGLGLLMYVAFGPRANFRSVNGLLLVGLAWLMVFIIGSIPFMLFGMNFLDAFFESVSCFTTTGSSVMEDPESADYSMLLWRALSQWIGGLMVILVFMYMLPSFGIGRNLFINELSGSGSSTFSMRITNAARSFITVYIILTLLNFLVLILLRTEVMDALTLCLTTISTGGMCSMPDSMMHMTWEIQVATMVFMLLGGLNFYLHFTTIFKRSLDGYRNSSEFRLLLIWFVSVSIIIYVLLLMNVPGAMSFDTVAHLDLLKDAFFTTVSMGTTAGFYSVDYCLFPPQCIFLLFIVTFIGASAGSTAGGVKFGRLIIIFQFVKNSVNRTLSPNEVSTVKVDGQAIDPNAVHFALCIFIMYAVTLLLGGAVIMMFGFDFVDAIGLSLSSVTNVGLGFDNFGPGASLSGLANPIKITMMVLMWLGRLEIIVALSYVSPQFWREVWFSHRARKRTKYFEKQRHADRFGRSSAALPWQRGCRGRPH